METLQRYLLPEGKGFISVTGGGGKTSFLISFGRYLRDRGLSVLLTTTTRIESPKMRDYDADLVFSDESILRHRPSKGETVYYAERHIMDPEKWTAPREEVLSVLASWYDAVLCEADGSRHLPLKIHTARDPVIHPATTGTVAVMGLWGIGEAVDSAVFGDGRTGVVDEAYLDWYLKAPEGLMKGMTGHKLVLLNGAESYPVPDLSLPEGVGLIAASLREGRILSYVL